MFMEAKHPPKVHVCTGISLRGGTEICMFEGIMEATKYTEILEQALLL